MATLAVFNCEGKEVEQVELADDIFGRPVNQDLIHQAVVMYQACLRQGNAATKDRSQVSGGGVKPWRQKGTGRARAGSSRSPLWRHGGVTFGPQPRDYSYAMPRKMKVAALRESLNARFQDQGLYCLTDVKDKILKTKEFSCIMKALNLKGKVLALLEGCDESVFLASRNIPRFQTLRCEDVNAYDVVKHKNLLLTKTSLQKLLKRIK